MPASSSPHFMPSVVAPGGTAPVALRYASRVHAAIDRRMPEASALADWLQQNAETFGLVDTDLLESFGRRDRRRVAVPAPAWRAIGAAIASARARLPDARDRVPDRWAEAIATRLGFETAETAILALALYYRIDQRVERLFDKLSDCRDGPTIFHLDADLIGLLLGEPTERVERCLAPDGRLLASGLLHVEHDGELELLPRLVAVVRRRMAPGADFYDQLLGTTTTAPLPWEAFGHLGREAELAADVLRAALAQNRAINILLYGPPGTGKTSFAASLAAKVGARLRSVVEADETNGEPTRIERLYGLRLAHRLAVPGETVLLFDEAEDLFARAPSRYDRPPTNSRVFLHRLLEQGTAPVIWTANDIEVLGSAVLRRMTMCLELKIPNLAIRTKLWRRMGETEGVALGEADAARLARLVPAAPAVAATALRATKLVGGDADTARLIVEGVARAVRGGHLPAPEPETNTEYDPALFNADGDLAALADRLCAPGASRAVSFLLAGPPGSGKSAWVRHLAGRMGLPVLQRRASDLLGSFVGETEQNIAAAFAEAREQPAFLVFDEADSLLLDRGEAVRGWEISQVNEMLTWMETHELPFACTTNLAERLDRASLRRFLVKLRFSWMDEAQARAAFRRFFGLAAPPGLDALRCLTPADFALVRRRAALEGVTDDAAALVRMLAAECEGRTGGRGPLGFAAAA